MIMQSWAPIWASALIGAFSFGFRLVAQAVFLILPVWREAFPSPAEQLFRSPTWAAIRAIPAARARAKAFVRRQLERLALDRNRAPLQGGHGLACAGAF